MKELTKEEIFITTMFYKCGRINCPDFCTDKEGEVCKDIEHNGDCDWWDKMHKERQMNCKCCNKPMTAYTWKTKQIK